MRRPIARRLAFVPACLLALTLAVVIKLVVPLLLQGIDPILLAVGAFFLGYRWNTQTADLDRPVATTGRAPVDTGRAPSPCWSAASRIWREAIPATLPSGPMTGAALTRRVLSQALASSK